MAEKKTAAKGYQKFKADLAAGTLGEEIGRAHV